MNVALCREDGTYAGNELLTVRWRVSRVALDQLQAIEVSVMWHTEGKGDEDLNVHHFHRLDENQIRRAGLADEQSLSCRLPVTPLSYHGRLISVRWCVRLRLYTAGGREIVAEQPFHLIAASARPDLTKPDEISPSENDDVVDMADAAIDQPIVLS
ncbi:MAG: hypothetical protein HKN47_26115 [Pirellulaceae bacterium]|nr:hypothetical protein [Pirellulaceae bacterium]